jgi:hypothetical protein
MSDYVFDENFPFEEIKIKNLKPLQGGTFLASLELNEEPIVIQTPKCKTKHGIHKTSKTTYCDLLLQSDSDFLVHVEKLEEHIRGLILDNSEKWFSDKMSLDDIEYHWNGITRNYKNNKLMRTYVQKNKRTNKFNIQIYNENEEEINAEKINNESDIICILEIIGLKFSSQSFYLEAMLRQVMVFDKKEKFKKCMIKVSNPKKTVTYIDESKNDIVDTENVNKEVFGDNIIQDKDNVHEQVPGDKNMEDTLSHNNGGKDENDTVQEIDTENKSDSSIQTTGVKINDSIDTKDNLEKTDKITEIENDETIDESNENNTVEINETDLVKIEPNENDLHSLEEVKLDIDGNEPEMKLKQPNEVYLDIYRAARLKAKQAKALAVKAYLEAKKIKKLYMLDEVEFSSSSDEEEINF